MIGRFCLDAIYINFGLPEVGVKLQRAPGSSTAGNFWQFKYVGMSL